MLTVHGPDTNYPVYDLQEAVQWFEASMEKEQPEIMCLMASLYHQMVKIKRDYLLEKMS